MTAPVRGHQAPSWRNRPYRFVSGPVTRRATPLTRVWGTLLCVQLPPSVQVVVIQDGVEHQEIAADRLATPHGIVGEQHHVSLLERRVHHHGPLRDVPPTLQQS